MWKIHQLLDETVVVYPKSVFTILLDQEMYLLVPLWRTKLRRHPLAFEGANADPLAENHTRRQEMGRLPVSQTQRE